MTPLTPEENATRRRFRHRAWLRAPVAVCWDVFTDHERLAEFTDTSARIIEPGKPERNGLGCVRRLELMGQAVDEVVNYWRVNEVFGYHVMSAGIVSHHQGIVRFWPTPGGGSEWLYDMQLVPDKALLTAVPDLPRMLMEGFQQYVASLECECERRAAEFKVPAEPIPVAVRGGQLLGR